MNSKDSSTPTSPPSNAIRLQVRGLGHIVSFKNKKRAILDSNTGHMRTLTEPKAKQQMKAITESFVLQLLSVTQTNESGTTPGLTRRSAIVWSLPWDDSRQWIPETVIHTVEVEPGAEGADITIEQL